MHQPVLDHLQLLFLEIVELVLPLLRHPPVTLSFRQCGSKTTFAFPFALVSAKKAGFVGPFTSDAPVSFATSSRRFADLPWRSCKPAESRPWSANTLVKV